MSEQGISKTDKSTLVSRNITVMGQRTSVRLEPAMWTALKDISQREGCSIHDLCSLIKIRKADDTSLTAAIRVFFMLYYRASSTEDGHIRAHHGDFSRMVLRARISSDKLAQFFASYVPEPVSRMISVQLPFAKRMTREMQEREQSARL